MKKGTRKKRNVTVDCGTNLAIAKDNDEAQEDYLNLLVLNSQAVLINCGKIVSE